MIYFDWAATSQPHSELLKKAYEISLSSFANPSSPHEFGLNTKKLLEQARTRCATALALDPRNIYFTSGGTESNHLPLLSILLRPQKGSIAISNIEHPSIMNQAKVFETLGWKVLNIPSTKDGFITKEAVLQTIKDDTTYVSVMAVNNETGAIQHIEEIGRALQEIGSHTKKPFFHVDAVQAIGKIPFCIDSSYIDSLSISAHKLQGPKGIGILYCSKNIEPFIKGGSQEQGIRPGTENLYGAISASLCLEHALNTFDYSKAHLQMEKIISSFLEHKDISIIPTNRSSNDPRFSPWITQFSNSKLPAEVLVRSLSDKNIYVSTGSACSSKKKTRPILEAMKIPSNVQQNAFRVSIGPTTSDSDIEQLITRIKQILDSY